jgi:trehalose 2-sulfotransferase
MDSPPATAYLVCATPRSGSTLLCETLRATGLAGSPREHFEVLRHSGLPRQPREYLAGVRDEGALELLAPLRRAAPAPAPAELPEAWRARILRAGRSENGVWGGKLMWGHVEDLVGRARSLDGPRGAGLAGALHALLGSDVRFVFVTRADKVAQAVSLWRAVQTQRWRAEAEGPAPRERAEYRFAAIDHLVVQLEQDEAAWQRWFRAARVRPLHVPYEQLSADPCGTVAGVLRFLGLPADDVPAPALRHQRDARSRAWARRYRLERRVAA